MQKMISKVLLGLVICIYCNDGASSQTLDFNGTDVASPQALRSNVESHRQNESKKLPQIKPGVVTNSHRPQYFANSDEKTENRKIVDKINKDEDLDTFIDDEEDYKPNHHLRNKHNQIKTFLVKLLEKHEQKLKFAQFVPILRMLTPPQRLVMASLVSKQISAGPKNPGLNIEQVKAMFGNNPNITSDLMLPILLDIANMIRDAKDHMKQHEQVAPQAQLLRRSFDVDEDADSMDDQFYDDLDEEVGVLKAQPKSLEDTKSGKIAAKIPSVMANSNFNGDLKVDFEIEDESIISPVNATVSKNGQTMTVMINGVNQTIDIGNYSLIVGNGTDLGEELPVAEHLRAVNRFIDRNGNIYVIARPPWNQGSPKLMLSRGSTLKRKSNNDFLMASQRRRVPGPGRKSPMELNKQKCDMFTNTLCLDSIDYPAEAIMGSIRRNQAAMAALLADFPEISADSAIDGVSAKQENKYTPEYYMNTISRREDGTGSEKSAGFMCPSTVKYARPQKARATSGQWKYIVNTGEYTQTLRLEKCLKPREPCTYLTDNFKSKCVQVYNYHRLLTWDQQNGLHMDIFKVPTCCSCHIEGYSVAFPPHAPRPQESTSERFPGEDLSHDHNGAYEEVQSSIRHTSKYPVNPQDSLSILGDNHNHIPGSSYKQIYSDENPSLHDLKHLPPSNQFDSINTNFHTDVYQHQGNIRNIKKPPRVASNNAGLPSFLEPPSKPPGQANNFIKTPEHQGNNKYKQHSTHYKRGAGAQNGSKRPNRRPLRKKNSNVADDQLVGATNIHENPTIINMESFEDINESIDVIERTPQKVTTSSPVRTLSSRNKGSSVKFSIKNTAQTTERYRPKSSQNDHGTAVLKDISLNRRVNYNYHPIIDFFEESAKKNVASDRMDTGSVYLSSDESDWRPMAAPTLS